jgi:hypothetical protein
MRDDGNVDELERAMGSPVDWREHGTALILTAA